MYDTVKDQPVSHITWGHILSVESRGQGAEQHLVGTLRTTGSNGTLYHFRAIFA
jgi:hypothetical protein